MASSQLDLSRDAQFAEKAGRVLDLYASTWNGTALGPDEFVVSADEKPSLQRRRRKQPTLAPGPGRPMRVEHEYFRTAALTYLAAWVTGAAMSFTDGTVEVVSVCLDAEPAAVGEFAQCLSNGERLRAGRFVFERDRRRFIVGRARLRHLLASLLGVQPDAVELVYGPRGKPVLSRRFADSDLRFNVSHSEDVAVYAFSRGLEIGVDVEAVRELRDADDIAARFFSRRENEAYLALDPRDKPLGFFNCWTRKEAFIKALGDGLYYPLDRFDVSLTPGEPAKIRRVDDTCGNECGWSLEGFSPAPGFVAAVVTGSVPTKVKSHHAGFILGLRGGGSQAG